MSKRSTNGRTTRTRIRSTVSVPLRIDLVLKDLCKCACHDPMQANPHSRRHCKCIPHYRVDESEADVVQ